VQLKAVLAAEREMTGDDDAMRGFFVTFKVRINGVHLIPDILMEGHRPDVTRAREAAVGC
jgi:hypothetical protein